MELSLDSPRLSSKKIVPARLRLKTSKLTEAAQSRSKPKEAASHALGSDTTLRLVGRSWLASFGSRAYLMQRGRTGQVMRMNRKEHGPDSSGAHDVTGMAQFDRTATNARTGPRRVCIHQIGPSSHGVAAGSGLVCVH